MTRRAGGAPAGVLIADDDAVFGAALASALRAAGLPVFAHVRDGIAAVDRAITHRPEVALIDLLMPGWDGIVTTRRIVTAAPATRVLVVTLFPDTGLGMLALRAGAEGYVAKEAGLAPIVQAVVRLSVSGPSAALRP